MSVFIAGNLVLDQLLWPVERVRWDSTVWAERFVRSLGGNGANTSFTIARMGVPAALAGAVGHDLEGDTLIEMLQSAGVNTTQVDRVSEPTPTTIALVKRTGSRAFIHRPGASRVALSAALDMLPARHFHLANPFGVPALRLLGPENLRRAKAAGMSTSLDTGWDSKGEWGKVILPCAPFVDIMFLNAEEARLITGARTAKASLQILRSHGAGTVVLKRGKQGSIVSGDGFHAQVPGYPVEAIDSTGAGDVFAGSFLAAWLKGFSLTEAAQFANAAAALSVTELGSVAGVRDFRQTLAWMKREPFLPSSSPRA